MYTMSTYLSTCNCTAQVLDKQLQHTLSLGYVPHLETGGIRAHVRAAVAEVSHSSSNWRVTVQCTHC
jgi:hypothetical protein